jgi:hypothetical protein
MELARLALRTCEKWCASCEKRAIYAQPEKIGVLTGRAGDAESQDPPVSPQASCP